jgi:hypothetical protein
MLNDEKSAETDCSVPSAGVFRFDICACVCLCVRVCIRLCMYVCITLFNNAATVTVYIPSVTND